MYDHAFSAWIAPHLARDIPSDAQALHFNLYEASTDTVFEVQLVACPVYDPNDEDGEWACNDIWSTGEDLYTFSADSWEAALDVFTETVRTYLDTAPLTDPLRTVPHLTAAFVDGDIEVIR